MSDFNSSLPVRTENNGDVVSRISDGTITSQLLTVNADGSVNVTDNGGSLTVDATNLDIRDLAFASDKVDVSGSAITATVDATDLDIRDLSAAQDNVAISDGTDQLEINADGSLNAVVSATDLDIRDLAFASDKADVSGSTVALDAGTLAALESITVQNGSGAAAVNIQDGGNSITVDANNLDIRDLVFASDKVDVSGSSVTVTATDLDIRNLSHSQDSVKIGDGTDFLAINTDGSINVVPQEDSGTEVVDYNTSAALAAGASSNHDHTFTAASKFYQIVASGSGKIKIEVQVESGAATGTFASKLVAFNSTAAPTIEIALSKFLAVPLGARIRVIRKNLDLLPQDVYSTIVGIDG